MKLRNILIIIFIIIIIKNSEIIIEDNEIIPCIEISMDDCKDKIINNRYDYIIDIEDRNDQNTLNNSNIINIPYIDLKNKIKKISTNKKSKILIVSDNSNKSKKGSEILSNLAYKNIEYLNVNASKNFTLFKK